MTVSLQETVKTTPFIIAKMCFSSFEYKITTLSVFVSFFTNLVCIELVSLK